MRNPLILLLLLVCPLVAKTIAEKKATISHQATDLSPELLVALSESNGAIDEKKKQLADLYIQVEELHASGAAQNSYKNLLEQINAVRAGIGAIQQEWQKTALAGSGKDGYALWHQPDTTIGQLVIDYGSTNYVYLLSPEVADIKVSVSSNLPIPTASFDEMMELILAQNGVGVRQLNPYLRQLYTIKNDRSALKIITNNRNDLHVLPANARVAYVLSPEPADCRRIWTFLEKFVNPKSSSMQMVGRDIFIVATVEEVQDVLKLYDFVASNKGDREYRVVPLRRVDAEEMARILSAIFEQFNVAPQTTDLKARKAPKADEVSGLRIITLAHVAQAVFLVGTQEEIKKAEEIIREVENQVGASKERVIHWYTAKHSDPEDLAAVLYKIYDLMVKTCAAKNENTCPIADIERAVDELHAEEAEMTGLRQPFPPRNIFDTGYFLDDRYIVRDDPELRQRRDPNRHRSNFIVDPKTNAIVMVVEAPLLPQMKDLIKRLDVPKKMVQLEVLLFEKKIKRENDFGLNLLKIGSLASDTNTSSALWNDRKFGKGVFEYLLSRDSCHSGGLPAFDLIYKFLMTQDDITINATPSVVALNQTLAQILIEEEISVNTGIFEIPTEGAVALKDAFARARYGIKIEILPTIHLPDEDMLANGEKAYVTMETDVIFETFDKKSHNPKQPDVTRRVIKNQVRVADGETVILGGLRRKITEDKKEMIPFIGEIPGLGKLFSMTEMEDASTEMYIFIKPTIIYSAQEGALRVRQQELCKRPGDIPCFLSHLVRAREWEQNRMMTGAMDMLFGRERDRVEIPLGEYDGRCSCN